MKWGWYEENICSCNGYPNLDSLVACNFIQEVFQNGGFRMTEEQLKVGKALSAYNAVMQWFDKASGVQIKSEDAVKCMMWMSYLGKLAEDSPEYKFVSDNYEKIFPIALEDVKKRYANLKLKAEKIKKEKL